MRSTRRTVHSLTAALASALVALPAAGATSAEPTPVVIECTGSPVSVSGAPETTFVLQGSCGEVVVTGADLGVSMESATSLLVSGDDQTVIAVGHIETVLVQGRRNDVAMASAGEVTVSGRKAIVGVSSSADKITIKGRKIGLGVNKVDKLLVEGKRNKVGRSGSIVLKAGKAVIRGSRNLFAFGRLAKLKVRGSHNLVSVVKGHTKVDVEGHHNTLLVNRRR